MTDTTMSVVPFSPEYRASGVLLHMTSLPSPYGIGDVGSAALACVDRLRDAGQQWWQLLPVGPTGYANSPYQSLCAFAGNSLLISPEWMIDDGLLRRRDCEGHAFSATAVDYDAVIPFKRRLLKNAWDRFNSGIRPELRPAFAQFCHDRASWLDDYALFQALKIQYEGMSYLDWPTELLHRVPAALSQARRDLADVIKKVCFAQFLLSRQAERLKAHARAAGVRLIGDLPIFVSPESSDVWAHPELFLLNEQRRPRVVAGVPLDDFSAEGQRWGNPIYDWDALRHTGYRWWIDRLRGLLAHVDVVRIDHFRAFAAAWHIPAEAPTAMAGHWMPGPGAEFFSAVKKELGGLPFIVEDLGLITPDVHALRDQFHLPGTRVLQFAFDGHADNPYLPSNYVHNTVVYTGTHDNPTTRGWFTGLTDSERENVRQYLKRPALDSDEAAWELIRLAWLSKAALAIVPLQDVLNLGNEARMNVPGRAEHNWRWRCTEEMLSAPALERLRNLSNEASRSDSGSVASNRRATTGKLEA